MSSSWQRLEAMGLGPLWQRRSLPLPSLLATAPAARSLTATSVSPQVTPPPRPRHAGPVEHPAIQAMPAAAPIAPLVAPTQLPAAGELLPWPELEAAVAACRRCRLCETRTNTVFGRGQPGARWLLVGEAPGENEDRQGLAFVGRAGQLLDSMLAAIGLDSETDVFITNVLKCRPPGNRNPSGDEIAACQNYLLQQIAHLKPTVIVALGRFAAQTLLQNSDSIARLRGKVHHYHDIPLIVSFHPAYLLRNLPDKAKAWQDLVLAQRTQRAIEKPH
ncbi:uracil-DNA glycosylase [Neisseriaceae bacterium JH1-16]|nr:uracil-DNA glycosylase [Neisseriaceae bacterium JH1-16]